MRCYYDVLGVPRNVEGAELKKAYYKMSLQWHPDKNVSQSQDTTIVFQEIQEAYRVLSDPQERAWYDSHRSQILQSGGQKAQMGSTAGYEEERVDVFQYFSRSCFQGFDDDNKGFYTVYRKVFQDIAEEEVKAAEFAGSCVSSSSDESSDHELPPGKSNSRSYPTFGYMESTYVDVVAPFYQFWEVFQTKKNYTWVEKYDVRCANSRPERRAMETENRRLRDAAKKKRNEEVRQLVAFVKKRDKRVAAERERVQQAGAEAQARTKNFAKQARQRNATKLAEAWNEELSFGGIAAQWEEVFEAELARLEAELDGVSLRPKQSIGADSPCASEDDADDSDSLYCVACDKAFASVNAKLNHESSKKHRKQVELLRQVLLMEQQAVVEAEQPECTMSTMALEDDCSMSDSDNVPVVPSVKLTKRAKKAQRKRLKEAAKAGDEITSDEPVQDNGELEECAPGVSDTLNPTLSPEHTNKAPCESELEQKTVSAVCETCSCVFVSRNQLFTHLKETGHAKLKPVKSLNQPEKLKRKTKSKR